MVRREPEEFEVLSDFEFPYEREKIILIQQGTHTDTQLDDFSENWKQKWKQV